MNKFDPEIVSLCRDIENEVKRKIKTPYDFEFLAGVVWERLHEYISPTTLKRLWGYIDGANTTRNSTLCLLSRFLGFEDWDAYLNHLKTVEDEESDAFSGCGVRSDELIAGQTVEVTWLPNRRCVFKYLGQNTYIVNQSHNAKLQVGDTFQAMCPLLVDNVIMDNVAYTFNINTTANTQDVAFTKCTLNGWTSYSTGNYEVSFTDCKFGQGTGAWSYAYLRPYTTTTLENCDFEAGYKIDLTELDKKTKTITLINCTLNGTPITDANVGELLEAGDPLTAIVVQ